jgi:hypothetical protein
MKLEKRFYVASKATVENTNGKNWMKPTLDEAIEHARDLCEDTDAVQYVVQVVKVVKPERKPVTVEDVE